MKFDIKYDEKLSEISETTLSNANNTFNKIKTNYEKLKEDDAKIAHYCFEEELTKPTTIYNLIFCVELHLKYYLLIMSNINMMQIEQLGHNINDLINLSKNSINSDLFDFDTLYHLLNNFKTQKNKKLDISKYENFRYNKQKKSNNLIFRNYKITQKEKENIREVLEWLNLHI